MTDFFDDKISDRLGGINFGKSTVIYKFELIKRAKALQGSPILKSSSLIWGSGTRLAG